MSAPSATRALAVFLQSCRTTLRSLLDARAGSVAVYVGLALPLFVGAAGLAVDLSSWYRAKRNIQSAADAAAYAAALDLARQGLTEAPDSTALQAAANDAAARNGVSSSVTVHAPPSTGVAAGDGQSVEVIASEPAPLYFTSLFLSAVPQITARAVAKAVVSDACVWSLDPSAMGALTVSGSANVDLNCGVMVNSDHPSAAINQTGSSCLSATSVSVRGSYSGSCVSPEPEIFVPDYGDPLDFLEGPTVGGCTYPTLQVIDSGFGGGEGEGEGTPITLTSGVYCGGLDIRTDVVLEPGLYVIKGGYFRIAGTATVTNNEDASGGVTFYLTGSGGNYATATIQGGADVTLTPMTTGPLANVLFYQDPDAPASGTNLIAGGSNMQLTGIIYFPSQHVEFTGGSVASECKILLVANTIKFTGTSHLDADYANSVLPQEQYARLLE